ncbi:hypothetical protein RhiJN_08071 [Ceratobasidium sp. AG-Ba]|nr:hypothetical protein RhiJN_08071 [Ceratobasidium sp. AG-Ba]
MSKRKTFAGGYPDSDGENSGNELGEASRFSQRDRVVPYAPPRINDVSTNEPRSFQLPQSSSFRGSVEPALAPTYLRVAPAPQSETLPGLIPGTLDCSNPDVQRKTSTPVPSLEIHETAQQTSHVRSNVSFERQINMLATGLEDFMTSVDERHQRTDDKLTYLTTIVEKMISERASQSQDFTPGSTPPPAMLLSNPSEPLVFTNPSPTAELSSIVLKVTSEARSRVGKKKSGPEENGVKDHIRGQFYQMLNISSAKEIRAFFVDEYGVPDTLPSQFADPQTGYIDPCPYWLGTLAKQLAWIPTYLLRVQITIPNNQTDLSKVLRSLTDEQILIYLNDGVYRTCQTTWRDMKKSDKEIETSRSSARQYKRRERRATTRARQIKKIPSLQGPEWTYLSNPGYVSAEESDGEGGLVVKWPDYRPQWEINLYNAIDVAEAKHARAKTGGNSCSVQRRIEPIPCPIPQLQRGTGAGKIVIQIPLCSFSKSWQARNVEQLKKSTHLVNMKLVDKPDINTFLAEHPMAMPAPSDEVDSIDQDFRLRTGRPDPHAASEMAEEDVLGATASSNVSGALRSLVAEPEIPIDPALVTESDEDAKSRLSPRHNLPEVLFPTAPSILSGNPSSNSIATSTAAPSLLIVDTPNISMPPFDMPPPPSPPPSHLTHTAQDSDPAIEPPTKRPRRSKEAQAAPSNPPVLSNILQATSQSQSLQETGAFDVLLARRAEDYTPKTKRLDTLHRAVIDASALDYIYEQPQEAATHQARIRRRRRRIQNRK